MCIKRNQWIYILKFDKQSDQLLQKMEVYGVGDNMWNVQKIGPPAENNTMA